MEKNKEIDPLFYRPVMNESWFISRWFRWLKEGKLFRLAAISFISVFEA